MKKAVVFALLLASFLSAAALAQTTNKEWQAKAVQKYPELGIQDSNFNKRFVAEYNQRRKTSPAFFADPKWPLILADELAAPQPRKPAPNPPRSLSAKWNALPSSARSGLIVGGGALIIALGLYVIGRFEKWRKWKRLCADSDAYFSLLNESDGLPVVSTTVLLHYNERAYYCASSSLFEARAVRHYESGFAGFRIARGLWVGGSRGRSVSSQEWTKIDTGTLTITNQRVIFDGGREQRTIPLKRIVSVECLRDSIELAVDSRQKSMIFEAANPLILAVILRLSSQGYDELPPRNAQPEQAGAKASPNGAARSASNPPPPDPKPKKSRERPAPEIPKVDCEDLIHARTLGLSGKFDFAAVKKHYHDRIREYHPDKVAALGPKLRELAETESKKINAAYEFFSRKLKSTRNS